MLGGWWATLGAIVLLWLRTARSCAWHEAQKQGEDKHSQQTLNDVHKFIDAATDYALLVCVCVLVVWVVGWVGSRDECCDTCEHVFECVHTCLSRSTFRLS